MYIEIKQNQAPNCVLRPFVKSLFYSNVKIRKDNVCIILKCPKP